MSLFVQVNFSIERTLYKIFQDIEECVKILIAKGSHYESESVAMYGLAQTIPDRSLVSELSKTYTETCLDTN
jgi:hypothetical protein